MPYAPGISYTGDRSIMAGKQTLVQVLSSVLGGLSETARQTKELRTMLNEVDPAGADQRKKFGLGELQGQAQAMELKQKQDAAKLVADHMRATIAEQQRQAAQDAAMGNAMKAATTQSVPMFPGSSGVLGDPTFQSGEAPQPGALVNAMMRNPGSEMTPTGRTVLMEYLRNGGRAGAGKPVFTPGPYPGSQIVQVPPSREWQLIRDPGAQNAIPLHDDKGNLLGYGLPNAKGGITPLRTDTGGKAMGTPQTRTVDGIKFYWNGKSWVPYKPGKAGGKLDLFDTTGAGATDNSETNAAPPSISWEDYLQTRGQ